MNKTWLISILCISCALLAALKVQEITSLARFYRNSPVLKLQHFEAAKGRFQGDKLEMLKLWESIITGRATPLSRMLKEKYQILGLSHIFTPSGFHLSAVLFPFMKLLKHHNQKLLFLCIIGIGLCFLPGFVALKRMLLIKSHQNLLGMHVGFIAALVLDMFFGSFQNATLSFSYSFLFLGIIYSGLQGLGLIIWFYIAQIILAFFQGNDISPLLLLFSPVLNLSFSFIMPLIFLLSFPLWNWQLEIGLFLLKSVQLLVDLFAHYCLKFPAIEVHTITLVFVVLILVRRWKSLPIILFFFCTSLNLDRSRAPGMPSNEFVPQKRLVKTIYEEKQVQIIFEDGRCNLRLVRGFWWENCSPKRRSNRNKKVIKKLSYPS